MEEKKSFLHISISVCHVLVKTVKRTSIFLRELQRAFSLKLGLQSVDFSFQDQNNILEYFSKLYTCVRFSPLKYNTITRVLNDQILKPGVHLCILVCFSNLYLPSPSLQFGQEQATRLSLLLGSPSWSEEL